MKNCFGRLILVGGFLLAGQAAAHAALVCEGNACSVVKQSDKDHFHIFLNVGKKTVKLTLAVAAIGPGAPCSNSSDYNILPKNNLRIQQAICNNKFKANYTP